uniref:Fibronectin type-III domain-containing protein n=1 Tax=Timema shepardi TaxID=629360 RepID=A0A7R9BAL2_TIMSH|nr:unnamed protein product [Timema shepardi]
MSIADLLVPLLTWTVLVRGQTAINCTAPGAATNLVVSEVGPTMFTFSWEAPEETSGCEVGSYEYCWTNLLDQVRTCEMGDSLNHTVSGTWPCTPYTVTVTSLGTSANSETVSLDVTTAGSKQHPYPVSRSKQPSYPVSRSKQPPYPVSRSKQHLAPVPRSKQHLAPVSRSKQHLAPVPRSKQPLAPVSRSKQPLAPVSRSKQPLSPVSRSKQFIAHKLRSVLHVCRSRDGIPDQHSEHALRAGAMGPSQQHQLQPGVLAVLEDPSDGVEPLYRHGPHRQSHYGLQHHHAPQLHGLHHHHQQRAFRGDIRDGLPPFEDPCLHA